MCFHNSLSVDQPALEKRYKAKLDSPAGFDPVYHANAYQFPDWPVVTHQQPGKLQLLQWGLIPKWAKSREDADEIRAKTLNARSETIFDKPSFRSAIQAGRRCLIPSTGFYEWHTIGSKKFPFFINLKNQKVFSIAGIWDEWADPETGEVLHTFSLLTSEANPLLARIHNTKQRMPVVLTPEAEKAWLHDNLTERDVLAITGDLFPADQMHSHSISKRITSRTEPTDVPEVQAPADYPELKDRAELFV
ncbi:SOS response-associated peptidase [Nibrella saemangeumensis]|uniref:Abasic site processing protein n=1 Tax=Nibrella saemangeumensis TaxID=1084526 RepID=A0ABP8NRN2_9BACT